MTEVGVGGRQVFRADDSTVLWGKDGELSFFGLAGTKPGPTLPLHTVPGFVAGPNFLWSTDGRIALYLAAPEEGPKKWELFAADASGPTPDEPIKVSAHNAASGIVWDMAVGPDPSYAVYNTVPETFPDPGALGELWMVPLDPLGLAVELSAPLPHQTALVGSVAFSGDGSRVLYTVLHDEGGPDIVIDLFLVDKANPGAAVQVNAPLQSNEQVLYARFTQDGDVLFLVHRDVGDVPERRLLLVDDAAPGQEILVSDPAHNVGTVHLLPPN